MVSPYLMRRLRSIEEALNDRLRQGRPAPDGLVGRDDRREEGDRLDELTPSLRLILRQTIPT